MGTFSGLGGAPPPANAKAPTAERLSRALPSTWRGPRHSARLPRTISPGTVARSSSASASSCAPLGTGRGIQGSGSGVGAGSGVVSNSTVVMSTPETPSTSAWCVLAIIAKRSPLRPLDEPDLPQRLGAVELLREEPARPAA